MSLVLVSLRNHHVSQWSLVFSSHGWSFSQLSFSSFILAVQFEIFIVRKIFLFLQKNFLYNQARHFSEKIKTFKNTRPLPWDLKTYIVLTFFRQTHFHSKANQDRYLKETASIGPFFKIISSTKEFKYLKPFESLNLKVASLYAQVWPILRKSYYR